MADAADVAGAQSEALLEMQLANRVTYQGESADKCVECGSEIPSKRQAYLPGVDTCVGCAEFLEHQAARRGR